MAKKTLEDLEPLFIKEPIKNKKIAGVKTKVIDWNLNSRNLMINLFFNVLKEKYRTVKGKLPSIDAEALSKMRSPIAAGLIKYRSNKKTLDSFKNIDHYIFPSTYYGGLDISCNKANIKYNVLSFDNVERIFTVAGQSIPINADKRARKAFIVPFWDTISEDLLDEGTRNILSQLE